MRFLLACGAAMAISTVGMVESVAQTRRPAGWAHRRVEGDGIGTDVNGSGEFGGW